MARHKINDHVLLFLGSENGQIEIYSLDESEKGRNLHSMRIAYSIKDHGPLTRVFYHRDVGLVISTFKGML